jgi:hypothetical protein
MLPAPLEAANMHGRSAKQPRSKSPISGENCSPVQPDDRNVSFLKRCAWIKFKPVVNIHNGNITVTQRRQKYLDLAFGQHLTRQTKTSIFLVLPSQLRDYQMGLLWQEGKQIKEIIKGRKTEQTSYKNKWMKWIKISKETKES